MTIKEFEYIRDNWDSCIPAVDAIGNRYRNPPIFSNRIPNTYQLYPFDLYLINFLKPSGDRFVAIPISEFRDLASTGEYADSKDRVAYLIKMIEDGAIRRVEICHRKVQRIQGYTKGTPGVKKWESSDWVAETRRERLKDIGI